MTKTEAAQDFDLYYYLRLLHQMMHFLLKMGQSRPLFVYFRSFLNTISIQIEKSVDGVLRIRTRGRRMVGADETTEQWRPPMMHFLKGFLLLVLQ